MAEPVADVDVGVDVDEYEYEEDADEAEVVSETFDPVCEIIKARDEDKMSKLVLNSIPGGESSDAIHFLQMVIDKISSDVKKVKSSTDTPGSKSESTNSREKSQSFFTNDKLDHGIITLALQFPDDTYFTAYVIGLRGQVVLNIGKRTGTRIKVENEGVRGNDNLRHIFIMGPLKGTIRAYQMLHEHLCVKANEFPRGTTEFTHMIIPNEIVSHIIGKGGRFIKELQSAAKVERIELQKDRDIYEQYAGFYGRYAHIAGDFPNRLHAVYLLLRLLAQDVDLPAPFFGDVLPVQYPRGHGPNSGPGHGPSGHGNGFNNGHNYGHGHNNGLGGPFNDQNHMGHGMGPGGGGPGYGSGMNDHNMGHYDQFNNNHMGSNNRDGGGHFVRMGPGHMGGASDQSRGDRGFGGQQFGGPGGGGGNMGGGGGFNGAPSMDVEVQVPSDKACVAFIYGPKGSAIIDMEQQSRCRIVFDKEPIKGSIEEKRQERKVTITGANAALTHRAVELVNSRVNEWKALFANGGGVNGDGGSGSALKRPRNDTLSPPAASTTTASSSGNTGYQNYPLNHNQNVAQNSIGPQPQQQQLQLQQQQLQLQIQQQQLQLQQQQQYGMMPYGQATQLDPATSTSTTTTQQHHQPSLLEQQYNQAYALFTQMQGAAQQSQLGDNKQGMGAGQVQGHGQYVQQQYPQAHSGR